MADPVTTSWTGLGSPDPAYDRLEALVFSEVTRSLGRSVPLSQRRHITAQVVQAVRRDPGTMGRLGCTHNGQPRDLPDAGQGACCYGAAMDGPRDCTCWTAVYDLNQQPVRPGLPTPPVPLQMCADCAYRPGSPERRGDQTYLGHAALLDELVASGTPFWCHQGMRRVLAWRHPAGVEVPGHPGGYDPPIDGRVPYRADGSPALICAGWLLRRARAVPSTLTRGDRFPDCADAGPEE